MPAPSRPPSIAAVTAAGVSRRHGTHEVLSEVSLTIGPETRLGVVGPNGVGKSTLLRILAGLEQPDAGAVRLTPPTATVGYLAQEPERLAGETVHEHLQRRTGVAEAEAELEASSSALAVGLPKAEERYADALDRWQRVGGADLDLRIEVVLAELGLGREVLALEMAALSGGQAARVALGSILLSHFEVTLLDEPTNNLDFDGLGRLERFVAQRRGGVVIVSHDRAFLDATVSSVLEIDEHEHRAQLYEGGWSAFLGERATGRRHAEERFAEYETRREELTGRARREREWATSGASREKRRPRDHDKAQRDFRVNRTEQLAARARRTERALERLDRVDKPWDGWNLRFSIEEAGRAGTVVARLEAAVVERAGFTLGPIDLEIPWGERVDLRGPNGSGKTTLLAALLGELPLVSGRRVLGPSVVVGRLGQERAAFDGAATLLGAFTAELGLEQAAARSLLAKFGLGSEHVLRPARSLSPGERTRAELAAFQARGVNTVVLDEPTNHLDLPAVEQLEAALSSFAGTLVVVTHDRRFREALQLTRSVELEGGVLLSQA